MRAKYDKAVDALYIRFKEGKYEISEELGEGTVIDLSKDGELLGIEILDASKKLSKKNLENIVAKNN